MAPPRREVALLNDAVLLAAEYRSSMSIAELAARLGVSASTVQRALVRHGIDRLPRNRNRRPPGASVLDDEVWLRQQYDVASGIEIAATLGVSARTVYAAMDRHGISRRTEPGSLQLRVPQLADEDWLKRAVEGASSATVAAELGVSAGTVRSAYERVGVGSRSTSKLYVRGRTRERPSPEELRALWRSEGSFSGVGRRLGVVHSTAAVWLSEIGEFRDSTPALSRSELVKGIKWQQSIAEIAAQQGVSTATVRIELNRHGLFGAHRNRHR